MTLLSQTFAFSGSSSTVREDPDHSVVSSSMTNPLADLPDSLDNKAHVDASGRFKINSSSSPPRAFLSIVEIYCSFSTSFGS